MSFKHNEFRIENYAFKKPHVGVGHMPRSCCIRPLRR